MKKLSDQLNEALAVVNRELSVTNHYAFLPEIGESLERMIADKGQAKATRERHAAALGRLVLEDFAFSESELGAKLLALSDRYSE